MEFRRPDQIQKRLAEAQQQARARWRTRQLDEARANAESASRQRDRVWEQQENKRTYSNLVEDASVAVVPFCPAYAMGGVEAARAPARTVQPWPAPGGGHATPPGRANLQDEPQTARRSVWRRLLTFVRVWAGRFGDGGRQSTRRSPARADSTRGRRERWAV